jgi:hypothetical protein
MSVVLAFITFMFMPRRVIIHTRSGVRIKTRRPANFPLLAYRDEVKKWIETSNKMIKFGGEGLFDGWVIVNSDDIESVEIY